MKPGRPSRTAMGTAALRAAHQVLEHGLIFADPLALRILGSDAEDIIRQAKKDPSAKRRLRLFIAARARFAEDVLNGAAANGASQLVVLGAGLDTTAYRTHLGDRLRIFEVDHPATQAWKRERLRETEIPLPQSLTFAPIDFERETLGEGLAAAGFDASRRTVFTWLGVVPYLTEQAVFSTMGFIGGLQGGALVVFDYTNPPGSIAGHDARAAHRALAARVAAAGEVFKTYFETDALHHRLKALGFCTIDDLGPAEIARRILSIPNPVLEDNGAHIACAATVIETF